MNGKPLSSNLIRRGMYVTFLIFLCGPYSLKFTVNYFIFIIFPLLGSLFSTLCILLQIIWECRIAIYFFSLFWAWTSKLDLTLLTSIAKLLSCPPGAATASRLTCELLDLARWSSARLTASCSQLSFQNVRTTVCCNKIVSFLCETANCRSGIYSHDLQLVWR